MHKCAPVLLAALAACNAAASGGDASFQNEVQKFLDRYGERYRELFADQQEARWASNTRIVAGDTSNDVRAQQLEEDLAAFTGSIENIDLARTYHKRARELTPLQQREVDTILLRAGESPQIVPELVKQRIEADIAQTRALHGFTFEIAAQEVTLNDIDRALRKETDLEKRRAAWEASKAVGIGLRSGLVRSRQLRNESVKALGHRDYFSYRALEYGLSASDLQELVDDFHRELRPLFIELHTWMRHELAKRYGAAVPDLIPAHWLPNRFGEDWSGFETRAGFDLDLALGAKKPEWIVEQGERFCISLGFEALPTTFWERSSLYPLAPGAGFKKNAHGGAWHIDLDRDVRCSMSVEPSTPWYATAHHELGRIYYDLAYSTPKIPFALRAGANPAYHEAIGALLGFAAMKPAFVRAIGLDPSSAKPDPIAVRLAEALRYVVFIPWSAGTMFEFEKALYHDGLDQDRWNATWWSLVAKHQGIAPPSPRGESFCDPATQPHVHDDPCRYYKHALAVVLLFQLHDHIARQILDHDPVDVSYWGRREVGDFLRSVMKHGATADWRRLLRDRTGSDLSARAMVDYFEPLFVWLKRENAGRKATLLPLPQAR